jgi:hypothetical protein
MRYIRRQFIPFGKSALAALLGGIVLFLDAMAACPTLHEMIHKDADQPGHECAVTMFAHGKVDLAVVDVPVIVATVSIEATPQIEFSVFSTAIENLPHGRAPPPTASSPA